MIRIYSLGLALGWLFSSSVFVNNSVKVVSNAFDFEKDQCEDERNVRRQSLKIKETKILFSVVRSWFFGCRRRI